MFASIYVQENKISKFDNDLDSCADAIQVMAAKRLISINQISFSKRFSLLFTTRLRNFKNHIWSYARRYWQKLGLANLDLTKDLLKLQQKCRPGTHNWKANE